MIIFDQTAWLDSVTELEQGKAYVIVGSLEDSDIGPNDYSDRVVIGTAYLTHKSKMIIGVDNYGTLWSVEDLMTFKEVNIRISLI